MSVFWLLLLFGILVRIAAYRKAGDAPLPVQVKKCPLHSWEYLEQPGMEGVTYMQCKDCKMIPNGGRE